MHLRSLLALKFANTVWRLVTNKPSLPREMRDTKGASREETIKAGLHEIVLKLCAFLI
jgi:hypothetical protein